MSDDLNESEAHIAQKEPYAVEVEEGRRYVWCSCGHSQNQPYCDGTHRSTSFLPLVYAAEKTGTVYFCGCKQTKNSPLCDGSHNDL
jgi:CDGSH iron-sulfur domain-containing protein 3